MANPIAADDHRPRRLRRLKSIRADNPVFFVTFCCAGSHARLADPTAHGIFIEYATRSPEMIGAFVGRYVLMPDHVHAFVGSPTPEGLSRWVGGIKGVLAAHWRKNGLRGPFWQAGFFDHLLRSNESYEEKWHYVLNNPVRKGLVAEAADWAFAGEIHDLRMRQAGATSPAMECRQGLCPRRKMSAGHVGPAYKVSAGRVGPAYKMSAGHRGPAYNG